MISARLLSTSLKTATGALTATVFVCAGTSVTFAQDPIHWSLAVTSKEHINAGDTFDAGLTATIDKGWHLYALDEPVGGPPATTITLVPSTVLLGAGSVSAPPGQRAFDPTFNVETEYFERAVTFLVPMKVAAGAADGRYTLAVTSNWVTCNDRMCLPPKETTTKVEVVVGKPPANDTAATSAAAKATSQSGTSDRTGTSDGVRSVSAPSAGGVPAVVPSTVLAPDGTAVADAPRATAVLRPARVVDLAAGSQPSTLGAYVGIAALMGVLSLVTPCVFPMVPITVSYFTTRARKNRLEAVRQALIYGFGIVLTFTGVGFTLAIAFGVSGVNRLAADPWLNLGVTVMFLAFALSLFGVWDIALPSKLVSAASKAGAGKGHVTGTILMGLAFTLTSFTCTAPFLGTLLVVASQGDWQWPLAGMLAFSSVFALPFVILAFVPQVLASLPRSGPWLIGVKAVTGLVEIAAAMKFLSNADLVWNWHVFTRPVVLASWVGLSIVLIAYLAGWTRLGPVPKLKRPGWGRLIAVAAAVLLGVWLGSGIAGHRLGDLEAFLPPAELSQSPSGEVPWILNDYDAALQQAHDTGQRILIDFTGYTCTNCRWMEVNMFPRQDVERDLARYIRVRLYTDGRGEPYQSFQKMEQNLFGTVALPYYAVMDARGTPIVGFGGLTRDPAQYQSFLRKGLE